MVLIDQDNTTRGTQKQLTGCDGDRGGTKKFGVADTLSHFVAGAKPSVPGQPFPAALSAPTRGRPPDRRILLHGSAHRR